MVKICKKSHYMTLLLLLLTNNSNNQNKLLDKQICLQTRDSNTIIFNYFALNNGDAQKKNIFKDDMIHAGWDCLVYTKSK